MSVPDAAIEAAAKALYCAADGIMWSSEMDPVRGRYRARGRAAVEAAMPAIREAIAQEIAIREAIAQEILSLQPRDMIRWMNEVGASDMSVKAATAYVRHIAASIVRGGTP